MIIPDAKIAMAASHDYRETREVTEKLDFWLAQPQANADTSQSREKWKEEVSISDQGFSLLEASRQQQRLNLNQSMDSRSRLNLMILQRLYESITGRSMTLADPTELSPEQRAQPLAVDAHPDSGRPAPRRENTDSYSLRYDRHERYQEQEKLEFKATGVIHTSDGRSINFDTSLTMSRAYVEESHLSIRAGAAAKIDPLVINFDGKGVQLDQTRFNFDLDADGDTEQLASLHSGSGFLVFDRNGDGVVNDGTELFGPRSGQGFAELAQFDEDGNHFIDEGDSIYNKLRIWISDDDGSQQLLALGDKNIGAIFLGHLTTPFQLKDSANQSLGEVAASGIYLREDGQTGVVQEINLTV